MTQDALNRLIAAVEAGGPVMFKQAQAAVGYDRALYVTRAHYGSLDAAHDLQEELLPEILLGALRQEPHTASGWLAELRGGPDLKTISQAFDQPRASRAWLLAILRAVRDMPDNSTAHQKTAV